MIEVTQSEFRQTIKKYTDMAIDEDKIIKVTSVRHRNLIVMSEETFKRILSKGERTMDYNLYVEDKIHMIEEASLNKEEHAAILESYRKELGSGGEK